jgi:hypothetical protein
VQTHAREPKRPTSHSGEHLLPAPGNLYWANKKVAKPIYQLRKRSAHVKAKLFFASHYKALLDHLEIHFLQHAGCKTKQSL